nr:hypothetical protein [Tanacetum cinerariifolium]
MLIISSTDFGILSLIRLIKSALVMPHMNPDILMHSGAPLTCMISALKSFMNAFADSPSFCLMWWILTRDFEITDRRGKWIGFLAQPRLRKVFLIDGFLFFRFGLPMSASFMLALRENTNPPPANNRPVLPAALRARINQELYEIQVVFAFIDSRLEIIDQFLNNFANQANESDDELVATPLVSPFAHLDNDSNNVEVLNYLIEYKNVGMLRREKAINSFDGDDLAF